MLNFIRTDLLQLESYTPNPGGEVISPLDRLDANESPLDLPQELKEKLAWLYQNKIETNRYPDGSHQALKEAITEYVNESANLTQPINYQQISVGNGSDELIRSILIATCLGKEGAILVANPTFSMYEILAKTLGISVATVGRSPVDFSINISEAEKAISNTENPPIRVIFIVHPNSPTGNALTPPELHWLSTIPEDILVVIDEAYFEFSQTSLVSELKNHPNWIILRTFSKAFRLAAHRVGYAIATPQLIQILEKIRLPYNLPSFAQAAAEIALTHRHLILPSIAEILREREELFQFLSQNTNLQVWPSAANFIYVRPKTASPETSETLNQIVQTLKTQGTLIRATGGGLRITIGTSEQNTRTLEHLSSEFRIRNSEYR